MCMVSMVYDQYQPLIPEPQRDTAAGPYPYPWQPITVPPSTAPVTLTPEQVQQIIDAFHKSVAAAKQADAATGAGDCKDPEKAKLEARVTELERRLEALEKGRAEQREAAAQKAAEAVRNALR